MGNPFQRERSAYAKAGTQRVPGDTMGTASRLSCWTVKPTKGLSGAREQVRDRSKSQVIGELCAILLSLDFTLQSNGEPPVFNNGITWPAFHFRAST